MHRLKASEVLRGLRATYGERTPSVHVLRDALIEGRVAGEKVGREWLIEPDLEAAAVGLRLKPRPQAAA
jgi:hypothetical protein